MAGGRTASSTSRAAATPRCIRLSARGRAGDLRRQQRASARCWKTSCSTPSSRNPDFDDESQTENTRSRLSAPLHPQRLAYRPRGPAEEHRHADRRRFRRHAADRQADAGAGHVPFPLRLHRQGRRHRARRHRAEAGILDLLRRALHAAPSVRIWRTAEAPDRRARRRLLAGQYRLDRRRLWHRQAHADQGDARAAFGRARRLAR